MSKDTVRGDDRKSFGEIAEEIFGRTDRDRYPIRDDITANTIANATVEATTATSAKVSATVSVNTITDIKPATPSERYAERVSWSAEMHFAQQSAIDRFCETGDHRYVDAFVRLQKFDAASKFN